MMHFVLFSDGGAAVSYRNTWFLHFLPNPTKPNCGIQRLNLRTIFKPRIVLSSLQEQYFEIVVRPFLSSQLLLIFFPLIFYHFFSRTSLSLLLLKMMRVFALPATPSVFCSHYWTRESEERNNRWFVVFGQSRLTKNALFGRWNNDVGKTCAQFRSQSFQ